jgi:hypothetical protein
MKRNALVVVFTTICLLVAGVNPLRAQSNVRLAPPNLGLQSQTCGSAVSSCVLKASNGFLLGVYAECTAACWIMVFNTTTAPSNGSTTAGDGSGASGNLVDCVDVAAGSSRSLTYPNYPVWYSVGITVAISSTACATLTLSAVGFVRGTYQ